MSGEAPTPLVTLKEWVAIVTATIGEGFCPDGHGRLRERRDGEGHVPPDADVVGVCDSCGRLYMSGPDELIGAWFKSHPLEGAS